GKLAVKFPTSLSLQNVFFEDQSKDTLLYGGELDVNINMLRLLRNDIEIKKIELNNIVAKVKRLPPDSAFNFQFIVDAFAGSETISSGKKDTSSLKMNIDRILLNNTRIIYKDAFTGNDMDLSFGHFDTKITTFDPSHLLFNIPEINLNGLTGYFYQVKPLQKSIEKTVADAAVQPDNFFQFLNKEMQLSNINVAYKSEPSNINSKFIIQDATLHPKTIDLKNSIITLNDAKLDSSDIAIEMASLAPAETPKDTVVSVPTPSFKIISGTVTVNKSNFKYDDKSFPHAANGMDYSHLDLKGITLKATNLEYSLDTTLASIQSASLTEKSGFILNKFTGDFEVTPTSVS
ncbi:MAG: AsmA family protein, partial [Ginsengibacter sp.]